MDVIDCARRGDADFFKEVALDVLMNSTDEEEGDSALSMAVKENHLQCCRVIYERCPSLLYRQSTRNKYTVLHHAAWRGDINMVKFLISKALRSHSREDTVRSEGGEKIHNYTKLYRLVDIMGETALHKAIYQRHTVIIELLLLADADKELFAMVTNKKATPLHLAVGVNNLTMVKLLIETDPDFQYVADSSGKTPLSIAIQNALSHGKADYYGAGKIRKLLLEKQPKESEVRTGEKGWTYLHHAAYQGDLGAIEDILQFCPSCAELVDNAGQNFLHIAVKFEHDKLVRHLLGMTHLPQNVLNVQDNEGNTPFHIAILSGNQWMALNFLYDPRVNKMTMNNKGKPALADINFDYDKKRAGVYSMEDEKKKHKKQDKIDIVKANTKDPIYCATTGDVRFFKEATLDSFWESRDKDGKSVLSIAAMYNHLECCREIYNKLPSLAREQSNDGSTALHYAALESMPTIVKFFIDVDSMHHNDDDIEKGRLGLLTMRDSMGDTPLHSAVKQNRLEIMKLLIEADDSDQKLFTMVNSQGDSIFHLAVQNDNLKMVAWLIEADINKELFKMVNKKKNTALHLAVIKGSLNMVKLLMEADPGKELLRMVNRVKDAALHLAVRNDNLEIVKLLIEADPNAEQLKMLNGDGYAALHLGVQNDNLEMVKLLIEADPENELLKMARGETDTPLKRFLQTGSVEMVKLFIESDPDKKQARMVNENEDTPLHSVVREGNLEMAKLLIVRDSERKLLSAVNEKKDTALHLAVQLQNLEMVRLLIEADPSFEYPANQRGETPLLTAMRVSLSEGNVSDSISVKVRKLLLEKQTSQSKVRTGKTRWTALHHATNEGDLSAIDDIIQCCPECLEEVDNRGQNFLHLAANLARLEVVIHILKEKKIPSSVLNREDNDGNTPLHIAALGENESLTECLLYDHRVDKTTMNKRQQKVLDAVKFYYDPEKAQVNIRDTVDEKKIKDQSDFDLVVGALIATVSFTAGITVPGGYINDGPNKGMAILSRNTAFTVFVISNTFALLLSLYAVFSHFCARHLLKKKDITFEVIMATVCTIGAIFAMVVAFISGSYAVLAISKGLATVVCLICTIFFLGTFWAISRIAVSYKFKILNKSS